LTPAGSPSAVPGDSAGWSDPFVLASGPFLLFSIKFYQLKFNEIYLLTFWLFFRLGVFFLFLLLLFDFVSYFLEYDFVVVLLRVESHQFLLVFFKELPPHAHVDRLFGFFGYDFLPARWSRLGQVKVYSTHALHLVD
jgi:hypothetical protein